MLRQKARRQRGAEVVVAVVTAREAVDVEEIVAGEASAAVVQERQTALVPAHPRCPRLSRPPGMLVRPLRPRKMDRSSQATLRRQSQRYPSLQLRHRLRRRHGLACLHPLPCPSLLLRNPSQRSLLPRKRQLLPPLSFLLTRSHKS